MHAVRLVPHTLAEAAGSWLLPAGPATPSLSQLTILPEVHLLRHNLVHEVPDGLSLPPDVPLLRYLDDVTLIDCGPPPPARRSDDSNTSVTWGNESHRSAGVATLTQTFLPLKKQHNTRGPLGIQGGGTHVTLP